MFKIHKHHLFLLAGILWSFAGLLVMKVGMDNILIQHLPILCIATSAILIFFIFFKFVFLKMVKKHTERISGFSNKKQPFYNFFDKKSYIIMVCMMTCSILLRTFNILPVPFIAFFYTGLGVALFTCGLLYIYRWLVVLKKLKRSSMR